MENLTHLVRLDLALNNLSNNRLSGKLPECLFAMSKSLGILNLRMNNISCLVPGTLPPTSGLKTLDLNATYTNCYTKILLPTHVVYDLSPFN